QLPARTARPAQAAAAPRGRARLQDRDRHRRARARPARMAALRVRPGRRVQRPSGDDRERPDRGRAAGLDRVSRRLRMALRIEDYAVIGDTHTVALVGRNGSIDWLCLPSFDSGACFAALLGEPRHGRWLLAPQGEVKGSRRHYRDGTLVLDTELDADEGTVRLVDFMPHREDAPALIRIVEGVRGRVPMRMELVMRFDYGSIVPWVRRVEDALWAAAGPDSL